jgi:hypothetical protein
MPAAFSVSVLFSSVRCTNYIRNDDVVPIDADFSGDQQRVYMRLAGDGMRVLGFARGVVPARPVSEYSADNAVLPITGLDFIGEQCLRVFAKCGDCASECV